MLGESWRGMQGAMIKEIEHPLRVWIRVLNKQAFPNEFGVTAFEMVPDRNLKRPRALLWIIPIRFNAANDN